VVSFSDNMYKWMIHRGDLTHRLVVYFADNTYEWLQAGVLLDFDEFRDEMVGNMCYRGVT